MREPNPPQGSSYAANWLRRIRQSVLEQRILPGIGYRVKCTTLGTYLEIFPGNGGSGVGLYRYVSMGQDHIVCREWDGVTPGTQDVLIAKPYKLRYSITHQDIGGVGVDYSSYSLTGQTRLATGGTDTETQIIVDRYLVDDLIFAISATTLVEVTTGSPPDEVTQKLGLLDLNVDGRAWAAVA